MPRQVPSRRLCADATTVAAAAAAASVAPATAAVAPTTVAAAAVIAAAVAASFIPADPAVTALACWSVRSELRQM